MKPTKAGLLEAELRQLRQDYQELQDRLRQTILEKERYRIEAERKFSMRQEFEELIGWPNGSTYDEESFKRALKLMSGWKRKALKR